MTDGSGIVKNEDLKVFAKIFKWCMENDSDHCDMMVKFRSGINLVVHIAFSTEDDGDAVQD